MIIFLIIVFILPCSKANNFVNDLNIKSKNRIGFGYKKANPTKIKLIIIKNYIHFDLILVEII